MILLKHLQLNNFLSHETTSIDFSANEKALIDGASGAGKSSIFDSIIWALYGQGRADNKSMVRKGAKKCSVVLTLRREDEDVIIERTATTGGKHTLEVSVQFADGRKEALPLSGVRETQAWIDRDLIGASYLLFINSVAYVQGNSESFVSQTAPKRKELLLEIVKAEDYSKYYENARQALARLNNDESRINGQIIELEANLGLLRASTRDKAALSASLEQSLLALAEIAPQITTLEERRLALSVVGDKLKRLEDTIKTVESENGYTATKVAQKKAKLTGKKFDKEELDKRAAQLSSQIKEEEENAKKRDEVLSRKPVVIDRNPEIARINEQIEKIKKQPVCPSGEKCPYSGDHGAQVAQLMEQRTRYDSMMLDDAAKLVAWTDEKASLPPAADPMAIVREMTLVSEERRLAEIEEEILAELPILEKKLSDGITNLETLVLEKKELDKQAGTEELSLIELSLRDLRSKQEGLSSDIAEIRAAISAEERREADIKKTEERIAEFKKTDLVDIQNKAKKVALVKDAFGSKGIETLVIDYLLPRLEDRINEVLSKLSDFRVRLDTQRKSSDGESLVEGLFITILNEMNEEMPFEAYSGGEKLKISVSISEALATLQRVGFRLFDETFIGLDENSTESFADVLDGLQQNFGQVFCISHLLQIKELFDKRLIVSKNKNTSYVK